MAAPFFVRWSQLLIAIIIMIIERICRGTITTLLNIITVPWGTTEGEDDLKAKADDPNWERGTIEFLQAKGYHAECHFTTTPDGYILGLHHLPAEPPKETSENRGRDGADEPDRPIPTENPSVRPVLIIHGFMMCSEAFTVRQNASDSLPIALAEAGFDVWLGNNRGNKYSHKHVNKKPTQESFWDFSLDDLARLDLPTMVDYVLAQTGAKTLTLIGFSQGTAQSFAYLSTTGLASKVNLFVALAPVSVPKGFTNPLIDSLIRARPDFIFLLFGKKAFIPFTIFWRNNLPRSKFVYIIDCALSLLFGWKTACIDKNEKALLYSHLYSHTSVKTVVQWFQMIQTGRFQTFDDYMLDSNAGPESYASYTLPQYQLGQIRTPVALFCGGKDSLPRTADLVEALPKDKKVLVHIEEEYEHLDFLWAKDTAQKVYPRILSLLHIYNTPNRN